MKSTTTGELPLAELVDNGVDEGVVEVVTTGLTKVVVA